MIRGLGQPIALWIALGISLFGSLAAAIVLFPHPYNWQRTVMSSLDSPRDNPGVYLIACVGLATSGLLLASCKSGWAPFRRVGRLGAGDCSSWAR
jgi:hypothetical protein